MRRNRRKQRLAQVEVPQDAPQALSRDELLARAKAAGLPGFASRWKTETIINKLKELNHAV